MFIGITYLGAFAELQNVIICLVILKMFPCYVRPSVHMNSSSPPRWSFMKFDI